MKIGITAITDVGLDRENNEDAFVFCPDLAHPDWTLSDTQGYLPLGESGSLIVIADGMGGTSAGEVASAIAAETISRVFTPEAAAKAAQSEQSAVQLMHEAVRQANLDINSHIDHQPETAGMGTTIVIVWIVGSKAHVAWCGDSRCYIYNTQEGLRRLTCDHSYVQELVDQGQLTADDAFTHPDNNMITRGLGDLEVPANADVTTVPVRPNDLLLLCSDGLCGYCRDVDIERTIKANYRDITRCRDLLLQQALATGGYDNICIAIASLIADDADVPAAPGFLSRLRSGLLGHRS